MPAAVRPTPLADRRSALLAGPIFALQFLTVVPPLWRRTPRPADFGVADACFPLVGLALGGVLVLLDWLTAAVLPSTVRAVALVAILAALTGALHLDGLVDTFDGAFAGSDRAGRLAIMRDPRAGTFGVVAVVLLLLLKVAAAGELTSSRAAALALAPCLGRWAIVYATWTFPYARPEGLGRGFKDGLRRAHVAFAGLSALGASTYLAGVFGMLVFCAATAATWALGSWLAGRLGGLTGDTYGALCETVETGVWLLFGIVVASEFG
jgi:adenosylcobinamide-GDP ribazoletransferase